MKTRFVRVLALAAASSLCIPSALAVEGEHKPTDQQSRMATCSHESKGLHGEEHHKFMSDCLKGHGEHATLHAKEASTEGVHHERQQDKMKTCNAEAGKRELKGDERRSFMSSCLKG
jgi:hypothetical protein